MCIEHYPLMGCTKPRPKERGRARLCRVLGQFAPEKQSGGSSTRCDMVKKQTAAATGRVEQGIGMPEGRWDPRQG
jgi:hypothetical protein